MSGSTRGIAGAAAAQRAEARIASLLEPAGVARTLAQPGAAPLPRDGAHLALAEAHLLGGDFDPAGRDLLALVAVIRGGEGALRELANVHALGPELLRSHASQLAEGLALGYLPIGALAPGACEVLVLLYSLERRPGLSRVVEAIQDFAVAAAPAGGDDGAAALRAGALDRVEVLDQAPGARRLLCGVHRLPAKGACHHALLAHDPAPSGLGASSADGAPVFHVKEGHLCLGRSRESASPWRGGSFLLLGVGAPRAGAGLNRIDELRRQHVLVPGAAPLAGARAASEDYRSKVERLRLANRLAGRYGSRGAQRLPAVEPLWVALGAKLHEALQGTDAARAAFAGTLNMMGDGLRYELGCEFPRPRVYAATDAGEDAYTFYLNEVPTVSGSARTDRLLVSENVEGLRLLDVECEPATNPANGRDAAWVPVEHRETLEAAGLTTWDTGGYLVLHLSSVLRKNVAELMGLQRIAELVRSVAGAQLEPIEAAPGGLPRFASVVRGLLRDEVPLHELPAMCECYLANAARPTFEVLEAIRALPTVHEGFAWNRSPSPVYRLGERLTALIREGVTDDGEATVLALEPEPTQEALALVREAVGRLPADTLNPVILCEDWRLRPFVRSLVELEFPHLQVVSNQELLDPHGRTVLELIEMEA